LKEEIFPPNNPLNKSFMLVMPLVQVRAIRGSSISIIARSLNSVSVRLVRVMGSPLMVKVPVSPKLASGHRQVTPLEAK
jgi:hypothetical protein